MLELVTYGILTLAGIALGTLAAAVVGGFLAYWIALAAMVGWKYAADLIVR